MTDISYLPNIHKKSEKPVELFQTSATTKTATQDFYILGYIL